jgi:hypothetical protein
LDELYGTVGGRYFIIDSCNGGVTFDVRRRYLVRPGADESRMLRDQRSPPFDLLMDGADASDYKTEVVRMRWPLSETDRWVERPALFPAPSWERYLTWARAGPGRYVWINRLSLPYWIPAAALLVLPVVGLLTRRRQAQRRREGVCARCGYDLRGSPGTKTCPECGAASAGAKTSPA